MACRLTMRGSSIPQAIVLVSKAASGVEPIGRARSRSKLPPFGRVAAPVALQCVTYPPCPGYQWSRAHEYRTMLLRRQLCCRNG